jgi:putative oxidoreductase
MTFVQMLASLHAPVAARLEGVGRSLPPFVLRLVMGWEFWESGLQKLHGENWFAGIQQRFPFPFDLLPTGFSWTLSTWTELIGAVLLWIGLGTRLAAFALLFVTFVATAAVHWPDMWTMWSDLLQGYAITDRGHGNFKLPLLFIVMLLPLLFGGAGKASFDHLLARPLRMPASATRAIDDAAAWALAAALLGVPFLMLLPGLGAILLLFATLFTVIAWRRQRSGDVTRGNGHA